MRREEVLAKCGLMEYDAIFHRLGVHVHQDFAYLFPSHVARSVRPADWEKIKNFVNKITDKPTSDDVKPLWRKILDVLLDGISLSVFRGIVSKPYKKLIILKLICLIISIACIMYNLVQTWQLWQNYRRFDVKYVVSKEQVSELPFPAITFCNNNPLRWNFMKENKDNWTNVQKVLHVNIHNIYLAIIWMI